MASKTKKCTTQSQQPFSPSMVSSTTRFQDKNKDQNKNLEDLSKKIASQNQTILQLNSKVQNVESKYNLLEKKFHELEEKFKLSQKILLC